jgi:hypothetical protein
MPTRVSTCIIRAWKRESIKVFSQTHTEMTTLIRHNRVNSGSLTVTDQQLVTDTAQSKTHKDSCMSLAVIDISCHSMTSIWLSCNERPCKANASEMTVQRLERKSIRAETMDGKQDKTRDRLLKQIASVSSSLYKPLQQSVLLKSKTESCVRIKSHSLIEKSLHWSLRYLWVRFGRVIGEWYE